MPFTFGGYPTYCPGQELRNVTDAPNAAAMRLDWAGKPNHFKLTLGCRPGLGWLLLRRGDLDQLLGPAANLDSSVQGSGTEDKFIPLRLFSTADSDRTFDKILLCGHNECISPGDRNNKSSIYLCPIADRRWLYWNRGDTVLKTYNVRSQLDASYIASSLNGGSPWTWQEMIDNLWPSAAGTAPTLPFTPHGTPEGFWFDEVYRMRAVQFVLDRLACDLKYEPINDEFTFVRLGMIFGEAALAWDRFKDTHKKRRIWDDNAQRPFSIIRPDNVRVRFRVTVPWDDKRLPYYSKDITVVPSTGPIGVGTYTVLQDDMYALTTAGTAVTNDVALAARALERAEDYVRVQDEFDRDDFRSYQGLILEDAIEALGETIAGVCWEDRAKTDKRPGGFITSLVSGIDTGVKFEDLTFVEPMIHECCDEGSDGGGGGGGGGLVSIEWCVGFCELQWPWMTLTGRFLVYHFTVVAPPGWQPPTTVPGPHGEQYWTVPCDTPGAHANGGGWNGVAGAGGGIPDTVFGVPLSRPGDCGGAAGGGGGGVVGINPPPGGGGGGNANKCLDFCINSSLALMGYLDPDYINKCLQGCIGLNGGGIVAGGRSRVQAQGFSTKALGTMLGMPAKVEAGCRGKCKGKCGCGNNPAIPKPMPKPFGTTPLGTGLGGALPTPIDAEMVGAETIILKSADQTKASDTTLANDTHLQFTMLANRTYRIKIKVFFDCGDALGADGFKYALTGPSSPTLVRVEKSDQAPGALTPTNYINDTSYTASTSVVSGAQNGGTLTMEIDVQNGANGGTFAFQWAQNMSDTDATTVRKGSSLTYKILE